MTVFHLISDLAPDGAQRCLCRLVTETEGRVEGQEVFALIDAGEVADTLRRSGARVQVLGIRGFVSMIRALRAFRRRLSLEEEPVVVAWMTHAIGFSIIVKLLAPWSRIVWNIRTSPVRSEFSALTWTAMRLFGLLSRLADRIVYNSAASELAHRRLGYDRSESVIIPNGLSLDQFQRDAALGARVRRELGFTAAHTVVAYVKRVTVSDGEPWQAHFVRAAAKALESQANLRFVCVGRGVDDPRHGLPQLTRNLSLEGRLVLRGHVADVVSLFSACDIFVSTSRREGFPNAVIEAMACELPCIVSDAGDAARIVGSHGAVVPFGDPGRLADEMVRFAQLGHDALRSIGRAGRMHVSRVYSIDTMVSAYIDLFENVARRQNSRPHSRPNG